MRVLVKYWSTLLCLHVNLPCFRAVGPKFTMWASVPPGLVQRGHDPIFLLSHLTRLSGEFSELVNSLEAKDMTFLGIFPITLCQVTDSFSSIKRLANSPFIASGLPSENLLGAFSQRPRAAQGSKWGFVKKLPQDFPQANLPPIGLRFAFGKSFGSFLTWIPAWACVLPHIPSSCITVYTTCKERKLSK